MPKLIIAFLDNKKYIFLHLAPNEGNLTKEFIAIRVKQPIIAFFELEKDKLPPLPYHSCYVLNDGKPILDKDLVIKTKLNLFRLERELVFDKLDIEFKKSFAKQDKKVLDLNSFKSEFYRNLPQTIEPELIGMEVQNIIDFPFLGNIIEIIVEDGGEGYERAPILTLPETKGKRAELHPVVENNKIKKIEIINPGTGYSSEAELLVGSPINGRPAQFKLKIQI